VARRSDADVHFRRLEVGDLPLLHDWLGREHVRRWWGERGSYDRVVEHYLPAIEAREPTDLYAILVGGRAVGLVQTYLVADYPSTPPWCYLDPSDGEVHALVRRERSSL